MKFSKLAVLAISVFTASAFNPSFPQKHSVKQYGTEISGLVRSTSPLMAQTTRSMGGVRPYLDSRPAPTTVTPEQNGAWDGSGRTSYSHNVQSSWPPGEHRTRNMYESGIRSSVRSASTGTGTTSYLGNYQTTQSPMGAGIGSSVYGAPMPSTMKSRPTRGGISPTLDNVQSKWPPVERSVGGMNRSTLGSASNRASASTMNPNLNGISTGTGVRSYLDNSTSRPMGQRTRSMNGTGIGSSLHNMSVPSTRGRMPSQRISTNGIGIGSSSNDISVPAAVTSSSSPVEQWASTNGSGIKSTSNDVSVPAVTTSTRPRVEQWANANGSGIGFTSNASTWPRVEQRTSRYGSGGIGSTSNDVSVPVVEPKQTRASIGTGISSNLGNFQTGRPLVEQRSRNTNRRGYVSTMDGMKPNQSRASYLDNVRSTQPHTEQRVGRYGRSTNGRSMNRSGYGSTLNNVSVPSSANRNQNRASTSSVMSSYWDNMSGSTQSTSPPPIRLDNVRSTQPHMEQRTRSTNGSGFGSTLNGVPATVTPYQNRGSPETGTGSTNGRGFGSTLNGVPELATVSPNQSRVPTGTATGSVDENEFGSTLNGVSVQPTRDGITSNLNYVQSTRPFVEQRTGSMSGSDFGSTLNGVPASGTGMKSYQNNIQSAWPPVEQRTRNMSANGIFNENASAFPTMRSNQSNNMSAPFRSTSSLPLLAPAEQMTGSVNRPGRFSNY